MSGDRNAKPQPTGEKANATERRDGAEDLHIGQGKSVEAPREEQDSRNKERANPRDRPTRQLFADDTYKGHSKGMDQLILNRSAPKFNPFGVQHIFESVGAKRTDGNAQKGK